MPADKFPSVLSSRFRLPAAGSRQTMPVEAGATDSLAYTSLARSARDAGRLLVLVCADASDMLRFSDEIGWLDPTLNLTLLPDWETLPYDTMSPHEDLVSERLETLWRLCSRVSTAKDEKRVDVLLVSAATAAQHIAPPAWVKGSAFFFKKGQTIDVEEMKHDLVEAGYGHVDQVMAPGEFCVRGEVIDVYPMGSQWPFRLDLFDNEIESIRSFDPDTQRSTVEREDICILPGHEFPMDKLAQEYFRRRWRETFTSDPAKSPIYTDMGNGIAGAGIEYYLPLFFEKTAVLADYLPADTLFLAQGDVTGAITRYITETTDRYRFLSHDEERPALPPARLLQTAEEFFAGMKGFARVQPEKFTPPTYALALDRHALDPAAKLKNFLASEKTKGRRTLVTAGSPGRVSRLQELLRDESFTATDCESFAAFLAAKDPLAIAQSPLSAAFALTDPAITVLTENELYEIKAARRTSRIRESSARADAMIRDISELKIGDPIVHVEHGIGRYRGLETIETQDGPQEFLHIDYAQDAKLFVPVSKLSLISRYTGADAAHAPLHSLGRGDWEKAKKKAAEKIRDTAAELLNLYALREAKKGFVYTINPAEYQSFCEGFAFEETPDQASAIAAVLNDMASPRPMDRLVCGDVGFGKTEVALRAAFVAAMNGKQVAVLCPTTLLAEQHAQTFKDRFAAWPIKVAELSRFRSGKETKQVLQGLEDGTVEIVIGTHKLLTDAVKFKNLGLVIVDEEHRFGVRQKEILKSMRAEVDVLTLTATPIPRTLAMSLDGIRDFSVIATAPEHRLAIKTFVRRESDELIREAIIRELKRGGLVYFLHNEVETIENAKEQLQALVPEARIGVAHGKLGERDLEHVMRDFLQQRVNVLLCSTIIETGIDVPNANTIIIQRADKLGLAQLHQLRGRVGRSHRQAYAYLMTPREGTITKDAQKRLEAIESLEDLGSGFYLSMHDMEIRGAGEVLGEEQSGEMQDIGYDLYSQMLKTAVDSLKKGETLDLTRPLAAITDINLHLPALLNEDYVPDVGSRLTFYKRLASAQDNLDLEHVIDDLSDRYGKLTPQAQALVQTHRLRLVCEQLGIKKIDAADTAIVFTFGEKTHFDTKLLIDLLQSQKCLKLLPPNKLRMTVTSNDLESRVRAIRTITNALSPVRPEE